LTQTVKESSEETGPQSRTVDEATRARISEAYNKLPLSFEENRGQVDREVKYISRGSGYMLFLTPTEAVLSLRKAGGVGRDEKQPRGLLNPQSAIGNPQSEVLRMKLHDANLTPAITGESETKVRTNYFKGKDPEKWHTGVSRYERVRYAQVYPGVDMIYYGQQQQLEYDFEVAPGADPGRIALEFEGVHRVQIEGGTGDLVLETAGGEVRQHKPVAYQEEGGERQEVESRYVMQGKSRVGIEVGEYDRTRRLVIDPTLTYSTYLGGSDSDSGAGIAVDSAGMAYVTGYTLSYDFPVLNEYQTYQDYNDVFVTKLDTNASGADSLLYSTYLGGSYGDNIGTGIAVDSAGIVYVTGYTNTYDFPVLNEYQTYLGGSYDAFVTKLDTNASGADSLLYSTYLGGSDDSAGDVSFAIAADASGYAYVTGETDASDFPTKNQYQTDQEGIDVFVTKLDTNASGADSLLYSTYLGGSEYDDGRSIDADASGHAYITGYTGSTNFPVFHQYQTDQAGTDAFVTKINTIASGAASLQYSTYLGGSDSDSGAGIAVDTSGRAYVTGFTDSTNFPVFHQYQTDQGGTDAFVTKINPIASGAASLLYSTYLGGSDTDSGAGIAVDSAGIAYVTGYTMSDDFPMLHQYQTPQGGTDAFVTRINATALGAASLLNSTYLGGSYYDYANGIAVDSAGNAYVTGFTFSYDFPVLNEYQTYRDYDDAFVTKLIKSNTISVSGRVTSGGTTGLGGVTMTISGSQTGTVVTSSNGSYTVELAPGGNYTITPYYGGLTFTPLQQSFTTLRADRTNVNFTIPPVNLSGKVTTDTGAGVADVTMTLMGDTTRTVNTASDGTYSFTNLPLQVYYTLAPSKTDYIFDPAQIYLGYLTEDLTDQNFIATKLYMIGGRVTSDGTTGLSNVSMTLNGSGVYKTTYTDSNGDYSFTDIPAGRDYTVTPYKYATAFDPSSQSISNLQADQTNVNFTVRHVTISGKVTTNTGTVLASVTVTLTGNNNFTTRTATTKADGTYSFTNLPVPDYYTLTPSKTGYIFDPAQIYLGYVLENQPDQNFVGTKTYTVSGRATSDGTTGLSNVSMTLNGSGVYKTTYTDSNGNYTFTSVAAGGDYTVTPYKYATIFDPPSQSVSNLQANRTGVNFKTRLAVISGKVTTANSAGFAGVTITLTDGTGFTPRTTITAGDGTYSFTNVPLGAGYRLTPSRTNYVFTPLSRVMNNLITDVVGMNFYATVRNYKINGAVKLGTAAFPGVTVTLTSPTQVGFIPRTTTTSSTGVYAFTLVPGDRDYIVTPQKTGFQFTPVSKSLIKLSANQVANFSTTGYSIRGQITQTGTTTPISGVTVTITSPTLAGFAARTTLTGPLGNYLFTNLLPGNDYIVEPTQTGFTFTPTTRTITNLSSNIPVGAATNFSGTGP
jgi:hypothetical protein